MPAIIPIRAIQEKLTFPALRSVELVMSMANVMPAVVPMPKASPCTVPNRISSVRLVTKAYPMVATTIRTAANIQTYLRLYASTR